MPDLAPLGLQFKTQGGEQMLSTLDGVASKAQGAEAGVKGVTQANEAASASFGQVANSANAASGAFGAFTAKMREYKQVFTDAVAAGKAQATAEQQAVRSAQANAQAVTGLATAHGKLRGEMQMTSLMTARMGREFIELGGMMATGIAEPTAVLNILVSMFAHASEEGLTFGQVMKGVLGSIKPFLGFLGTIGVVAGAAFGAAALAARDLNKEHKDLADGLDLDAKQMDRLKEKGTDMGVTLGDVWKGTFNYLKDALDQHTKGVQAWLSDLLDQLSTFAVRAVIVLVAGFETGLKVIQNTWKVLPAVIGDAVVSAANIALAAIEKMINAGIDGINKLVAAAKSIAGHLPGSGIAGLANAIPTFGHVDLPQLANPNAGAASALNEQNKADAHAIYQQVNKDVHSVLTGLGNSIIKAAQDRIKEDAGDPAKAKKAKHDPTDETDQKIAQVNQMLAQAMQEQLQATLKIVKDVDQQADIQVQIVGAQLQVKQAQVDRAQAELATAAKAGHISTATQQELDARLERVRAIQLGTAIEQVIAINNQREADKIKQAQELDDAGYQAKLDLLKSQQGLSTSVAERWAIEAKMLETTQQQERDDLAKKLAAAEAIHDQHQIDVLKATSQFMDERQENERQLMLRSRKLVDIYDSINDKAKSFSDAFKQHDWAHAAQDLVDAIQAAVDAFKHAATAAEKIQSIGGAISGIGSIIGGSAGGFLSGAGGGISAAGTIGSALTGFGLKGLGGLVGGPIGAIAGGLIGGLVSLFGGNGQKKQQLRDAQNQAAEQEAQRAQQAYEQHMQLELRLVQASGDAVASLAAQRQLELNAASAQDQALLKQIYDQEDRAKRQQTVNDVETEYLTLSGDKVGLLAAQRREENKQIDASLYGLVGLERAAEDASAALDDAKTALQASYDAEMQMLQTQLTDAQQMASDAQQTLTDLQAKRTQAHNDLVQAYQTEASAIQAVIDKFTSFGTSLRAFRASLDVNNAGLSPQNAYNASSSSFFSTAAKAQMGDETAMGDFQNVAQDFLNASASFNGAASKQYQDDLAAVKAATEKAAATADRTVSNSQQQLDQLKAQVTSIIKLDTDVLSVNDAIKNLLDARSAARFAQVQYDATLSTVSAINAQIAATKALVEPLLGIGQGVMSLGAAIANYQAAQMQQAAAIQALAVALNDAKNNPNNTPAPPTPLTGGGYTSTNGDYAAYVEGNKDLKALYAAGKGMAKGRTEAEFGVYHWANFGQYENRAVRPYAQGGEFRVGGMGGIDSQHVELMASPDEHVTVKTGAQMSAEIENASRMAEALEKAVARLEQLIVEAKSDKASRSNATGQIVGKLSEVVDGLDSVKRSVRGKA